MSQSLASPTPASALRRVWDDPDARSVTMGILGMVGLHLLLFLLAPYVMNHEGGLAITPATDVPREFNIELATEPEAPPVEKPPQPFNFVEANPNAPDNVPDKTNNFAAQNQQVAQEKPTPDGVSDRPALEGRTDVQSTQIVTGRLTEPSESVPPSPPASEQPAVTAQTPPTREQNPLHGFEKLEGNEADSVGSNIAKIAEGETAVPNRVEGLKDAPLIQGATGLQPQIDPKRPRPRPQVVKQQQVRPAIFQENKFGTQNIGNIAYDAKWSNYGQYLQKMIESVQIQWERILNESRVYPTSGTSVKVVFKMNTDGAISQIVSVDGTAGGQAEKACASAITSRAPYGPWTEDMIAVLGSEQELTFTFYYQ